MAAVSPTLNTDKDTTYGRFSQHYELTMSADGTTADTMAGIQVDPRVQRITIQVTALTGTPSVNIQTGMKQAGLPLGAGDWVDSGQGSIATTKTFQLGYIPEYLRAVIAATLGSARINIWMWG